MIITWTQGANAQQPIYQARGVWTWASGDGGEVAPQVSTGGPDRVVRIEAGARTVYVQAAARTVVIH